MTVADLNPDFRDFVWDLIDEQIEELRGRVEGGYQPTRDEVLAALGQLIQDRARMRGLVARQGATVQ